MLYFDENADYPWIDDEYDNSKDIIIVSLLGIIVLLSAIIMLL